MTALRRSRLAWLAVLVVVVAPLRAQQPRSPTPPPRQIQSDAAGQELAARVRASRPEENHRFSAILKTRARNGTVQSVPLECEVQVEEAHWKAIYQTQPTNGLPAEKLVIIHPADQPTQYLFALSSNAPPAREEPLPLPKAEAARPLGGSDFWLTDLGMEFLHWPQQRLLKVEMRKSRWCHVLESRNPAAATNDYSRVLCWLDKEKDQPLLAEAYDHRNKLIKEFSIGSVAKINGRWQVEDMKMTNLEKRSRTWLEFQY